MISTVNSSKLNYVLFCERFFASHFVSDMILEFGFCDLITSRTNPKRKTAFDCQESFIRWKGYTLLINYGFERDTVGDYLGSCQGKFRQPDAT